MAGPLELRDGLLRVYPDLLTPAALGALEALAPLEDDRRQVMARRASRRLERAREGRPITFLDPEAVIPRTSIRVQDARDGNFVGSETPADLRRIVTGTSTTRSPARAAPNNSSGLWNWSSVKAISASREARMAR